MEPIAEHINLSSKTLRFICILIWDVFCSNQCLWDFCKSFWQYLISFFLMHFCFKRLCRLYCRTYQSSQNQFVSFQSGKYFALISFCGILVKILGTVDFTCLDAALFIKVVQNSFAEHIKLAKHMFYFNLGNILL